MPGDPATQAAQLVAPPVDELGDLRARVAELEQLVGQLRPFLQYLPLLQAFIASSKQLRRMQGGQ